MSFSGWSKTFGKCEYGLATVVGTQLGSKCTESVETIHSFRGIRGLSGKIL